jgi:hypothetical protein
MACAVSNAEDSSTADSPEADKQADNKETDRIDMAASQKMKKPARSRATGFQDSGTVSL